MVRKYIHIGEPESKLRVVSLDLGYSGVILLWFLLESFTELLNDPCEF